MSFRESVISLGVIFIRLLSWNKNTVGSWSGGGGGRSGDGATWGKRNEGQPGGGGL